MAICRYFLYPLLKLLLIKYLSKCLQIYIKQKCYFSISKSLFIEFVARVIIFHSSAHTIKSKNIKLVGVVYISNLYIYNTYILRLVVRLYSHDAVVGIELVVRTGHGLLRFGGIIAQRCNAERQNRYDRSCGSCGRCRRPRQCRRLSRSRSCYCNRYRCPASRYRC